MMTFLEDAGEVDAGFQPKSDSCRSWSEKLKVAGGERGVGGVAGVVALEFARDCSFSRVSLIAFRKLEKSSALIAVGRFNARSWAKSCIVKAIALEIT